MFLLRRGFHLGEINNLVAERDSLHSRLVTQTDTIRNLETDLLSVKPADEFTDPQDPDVAPLSPVVHEKGDKAMLPILTSQRERLRTNIKELEENNAVLQSKNALLTTEIEGIRGDNVKLYEKIKFLQSYSGKGAKHDDTVARYSEDYEAGLNPFRKFHQQESQRSYNALRPYERLTLGLGRMIMRGPTTSAVFFCYLLLLHALVFFTIYRMQGLESCQRGQEADCFKKFADHMNAFHPHEKAG